jgi:uncharacterized protein YbjT (DUF2867 family)
VATGAGLAVTATPSSLPRLLLIGGGGGLVGRAVLPLLLPFYRVRSIHRHPASGEGAEVEWVPADVRSVGDWTNLVADVQVVLNLAWYRWESERAFRELHDGLRRLLDASVRAGVGRFVQVSVPPAPASMETGLPYLVYKRRFDTALATSGLSYRIVRPTMLFGRGDVLIGVMLRLMRRYPFFPMFGDGEYHVSPIAVKDLARVLLQETRGPKTGSLDLGGPERMTYRELTDRMYRSLGKRPRYWRMSKAGGERLAGLLVALGSTLLYPYEVEWLTSDMLGLPPYPGLDPPLVRLDEYLEQITAVGRSRYLHAGG